MLIALFTAMFVLMGGSTGHAGALTTASVKQMAEQVELVVTDPVRAETATETLDQLGDEIKAFEKAFSKTSKGLVDLYEDHEATSEEVLVVLDNLNSDWEASQLRAVDLRFKLKDSLTEEEWADVFGSD